MMLTLKKKFKIHTENTVWYKHNFFGFTDPVLLSIIFVGIGSCSEGGCMVKNLPVTFRYTHFWP